MAQSAAPVESPAELGAYLTDGTRLLKVEGVSPGKGSQPPMLLLLDCSFAYGEEPAFWLPVREALGWRRVIPG